MAAAKKTPLRVLSTFDPGPEGRKRAVMMALIRVFGRWTEAATALVRRHGITLPHFEVLMCLNATEGLSQQDLSDSLMLTKGNICVIVQKMEAAGWIDRRTDPADQRFHRIYLTDAGRQLVAKIMPEHRDLAARSLKGLSPAEHETLHDLLSRIDRAFDDILQ